MRCNIGEKVIVRKEIHITRTGQDRPRQLPYCGSNIGKVAGQQAHPLLAWACLLGELCTQRTVYDLGSPRALTKVPLTSEEKSSANKCHLIA